MQHLPYRSQPAMRWSVERALDWSRLDFQLIAPGVRSAMAHAYGQILRAEQLGLRIVRRMVEAAPEGYLRDVAREQLEDELRHVAFFSRVATGLGAAEVTSPSLHRLEEELTHAGDYESIMTLAQVMENAANALFNGHARQSLKLLKGNIRLPGSSVVEALMMALVRLVGKDEGAHVAAGMRILRQCYAVIGVRERHVLEERVQTASALMLSAFEEVGGSYQSLGLGARDVLDRIALAQQRYWQHFEIDARPMPQSGMSHG